MGVSAMKHCVYLLMKVSFWVRHSVL